MRVAIMLPDLRGGGAERACLEVAYGLKLSGHTVEFLLLKRQGELLCEAEMAFKVHSFEVDRARKLVRRLVHKLRHDPVDVLLSAMWPLTVIGPLAARICGFKGTVAVSEHGILSEQYAGHGLVHRILLRVTTALSYRLANVRIGVSRGVCVDMAQLSGLPLSKMLVIYNPTRTLELPTSSDLAAVDKIWNTVGPRLLAVGSLKSVKNYSLLLDAVGLLRHQDFRLILLGQGPEESNLRIKVEALGLEHKVIFAGFCSDPTPFYMTADLLTLSSDREGFGNVIVEALSCGLPVVATDCNSGPAEILEGGRFGVLTPKGDCVAYSEAIQIALSRSWDARLLMRRAADFSAERAHGQYTEALGLQ